MFANATSVPILEIHVDGSETAKYTASLTELVNPATSIAFEDQNMNVEFRTMRFEISCAGVCTIFGIEFEWQVLHQHRGK
jgi:hypothetical protein